MSGETNLTKLIASMSPELTNDFFVFCTHDSLRLEDAVALSPIATFQEKEGLTLVLKETIARENKLPFNGVFKRIVLNVHSSLNAVGLTAAVSNQLTKSNISANVIAGYFHDHVFVQTERAEEALAVLKALSLSKQGSV